MSYALELSVLASALHKRVLGELPPTPVGAPVDLSPYGYSEAALHELAHHVTLNGTFRTRARSSVTARIARLPWTSRRGNEIDAIAVELLVAKKFNAPFNRRFVRAAFSAAHPEHRFSRRELLNYAVKLVDASVLDTRTVQLADELVRALLETRIK
jgi:hypothetical protein